MIYRKSAMLIQRKKIVSTIPKKAELAIILAAAQAEGKLGHECRHTAAYQPACWFAGC